MTWRDNLVTASWRGVEFETEQRRGSGGRRLVVHEYPNRETPAVEDLGRSSRTWSVRAYLIGPDYMVQRDRLVDALEQRGAGTYMDHWRGGVRAAVIDYSYVESIAGGGGFCEFEIEFTEAGGALGPQVTLAPGGAAAAVSFRASALVEVALGEYGSLSLEVGLEI